MLDLGITFAVTATLLFAVTTVLSKLILKQIQAPYKYTQLQILGITPILLLTLLIFGDLSSLLERFPLYIAELILASVLAFFGFISLMIGLEKGNPSIAGIFLSTRVVFSIPLALIFLGEIEPWYIYLIIFITFIGSLMVSYDHQLSISRILSGKENGVRWLILTSISWSIANFFTTRLTTILSPFEFLSLRSIIFALLIFGLSPILKKAIDHNPIDKPQGIFHLLAVFIVLTLLAQLMFVYALSTSLTLTEGIGVFEGVVTFILSISLARFTSIQSLDESLDRKSLSIKLVGTLVATVGVILIVTL